MTSFESAPELIRKMLGNLPRDAKEFAREIKRRSDTLTASELDRLPNELAAYKNQVVLKRHDAIQLVAGLTKHHEFLESQQSAIDSMSKWLDIGNFTLEKPIGSSFHKLVEASSSSRTMSNGPKEDLAIYGRIISLPDRKVILIEHNWANAFQNATDFSTGEFKHPFDLVCYEFSISGKRVCVINDENNVLYISVAHGDWWIVGGLDRSDPLERSLADLTWGQIRSAAIALDAGVAVHEISRAPSALNTARHKRGKSPIYDYHVVSLARRHRAAPLIEPSENDRTSPRLHFRRGHWRHYDSHKSWIKWTLVGNPDLGFVDKHYRL